MNDSKYRLILYLIVFVIMGTIGIQMYWNYKNYLVNKQQFINDVQVSLDNAVESYFANLAEKNTLKIAFREFGDDSLILKDSIKYRIGLPSSHQNYSDSLRLDIFDGKHSPSGINTDSILDLLKLHDSTVLRNSSSIFIKSFATDSLSEHQFKTLTSKVIVSLTEDKLSLEEIDGLLTHELQRKNLIIDYYLILNEAGYRSKTGNRFSIFKKDGDSLVESKLLSTSSKSTYLPPETSLKVFFTNETKSILKRILSGIILSSLLVLLVIGCLFYLLNIIKHQKQLSELKNDLISNITHEFKTPISTIGIALESIKDFDGINNKSKTEKYLDISSQQLAKLNHMVEKLLETATLDSENLVLKKEKNNISQLIIQLVDKYKLYHSGKHFEVKLPDDDILAQADGFHFENAINNLLDNAVKYGGNEIKVWAEQNHYSFTIFISDSGEGISKNHKDKIFEKFYRIPQGNRHDVKGFGIGLFYTKTIIEKHGGVIYLESVKQQTTFKITLPNE